jgi:rhamnosyltransferase
MTAPLVSIVLATRNGAKTLPALFDAVAGQHSDCAVEVVAVDSASTDGTLEILRARAHRVISIAEEEFDHGLTRNLGIEQSRGELVILMVQDAVPASDSWLSALTAPLRADDRVAGAFARQTPREDASALARYNLSHWITSSSSGQTRGVASRAEFDALGPRARFERCAFDNVCSCIRRSVWERHPFQKTAIAEDVAWAKEVMLAGFRIAYEPEAAVIHSHDRPVRYEFARTYALHRRLFELFQLQTIPTAPALALSIAASLRTHITKQQDARAIGLAFAWPLGQYLGARSAARGWKTARLGPV